MSKKYFLDFKVSFETSDDAQAKIIGSKIKQLLFNQSQFKEIEEMRKTKTQIKLFQHSSDSPPKNLGI